MSGIGIGVMLGTCLRIDDMYKRKREGERGGVV
jgi:hypothetical protein